MPAHVFHNGTWVETDDLFLRRGTGATAAWREVMASYVYTQNPPDSGLFAWLPVFDRFQEPPRNVRGMSATHGGGKLVWDAPPRGTHYRVVMRTKATATQPARTDYFPANESDPWIQNLFWDLSGLQQDREYDLTVIARRYSPSDNTAIDSVESSKATLSTGHPAVNQESTGQTVLIKAAKSDTWSVDNGWGQSAGDVVQGYASQAVRNGYGGVAYTTAYSQLATLLNTKAPDGSTIPVADHVEVVDARIDRIYRKSGGSGTPTVEAYAWRYTTGDPRTTDYPTNKGTFAAPAEGASKDDFQILGPATVTPRENKLKTWATQWVKKTPTYNGMLIYRTGGTGNTTAGYNGYAIFRAANTTADEWRLKLTVKWKFDYPTLLPAKWTPGG